MPPTSRARKKKPSPAQLRLVASGPGAAAAGTDELPQRLRVAGLFAGIGGIEMGLKRAGHETALLCENDPGACEVLKEHFPDVRKSGDICRVRRLPKGTTLLTAGFPCQDLSQAGKTVGIEGSRSGLVGEVFRLLRKDPIPWVLLENVPFMLQLSKGRALAVIVDSLEELGYRWAYRVIDSRSFGVPQRRERVFLVATLDGDPRDVVLSGDAGAPPPAAFSRECAFGFYWTEGVRGLGAAVDAVPTLKGGSTIGIASPPAVLLPNGDVVLPHVEDGERMQGFSPGWTEPSDRVDRKGHRWKLVGNAVTVDVAEWIGRKLARPEPYALAWTDAKLRKSAPWPRAAWNMMDGKGRFSSEASSWPVQRPSPTLDGYLRHPRKLLSARAANGFLSRARSGSLRFPEGFLAAIEAHLERMQAAASA